jgi:hypothetical protein
MCTEVAPATLQIMLELPPATMLEGAAEKVFITGGVSAGGGGDDGGGREGVGDDGVNCDGAGDEGSNGEGVGDDGGGTEAVVVPNVTVTDLVTLPEALVAVRV